MYVCGMYIITGSLCGTLETNSVQLLSRIWLFATPWTAAPQASLSITNFWNLLKLMSIELVKPSSHLIFCRPLLLPSIFLSNRVFSNESVLRIRWPKYWSFSFNISPSNEYSVISFCLFILFMGFSRQENWRRLPFSSPVDRILSELSIMTRPSWVALHGRAHSSIELNEAVIHVISLVCFLWLRFSFCLPWWWIRIRGLWKRPDRRDWLWGNLGLLRWVAPCSVNL